MRRTARKYALQVLYSLDLNPEPDADLDATITEKVHNEDLAFAESLIHTVQMHLSEIDAVISAHLRKWSLSQLNVVDKIILRIGIAEMMYPLEGKAEKGIIINEAVLMSKEFGGENSYRFINGVLNAVANEQHL